MFVLFSIDFAEKKGEDQNAPSELIFLCFKILRSMSLSTFTVYTIFQSQITGKQKNKIKTFRKFCRHLADSRVW